MIPRTMAAIHLTQLTARAARTNCRLGIYYCYAGDCTLDWGRGTKSGSLVMLGLNFARLSLYSRQAPARCSYYR